jgi:hypothetical protein
MSSRPDVEVILGDRRQVGLRIWKLTDGVRVTLRVVAPAPFTARPDRTVHLYAGKRDRRVDPWPVSWTMVRGLPPHRRCNDSLVELVAASGALMYGWQHVAVDVGPEMLAGASTTMHTLRDLVRQAAIHAADRCDPKLRAIAMRFLPGVRYRLYRFFVDDETGRVAQLAGVCPGAVIFAAALREHEPTEPVGRRLLEEAIAGLPLRKLVMNAVHGWLYYSRLRAGGRGDGIVWDALDQSPPATRARIAEMQRLLVLRAGPRVPANLLELPPPLAFAPEDIPRPVRANARWYRVVKAAPPLYLPGLGAERADLAGFASAHAEALYAAARGQQHRLGVLAQELADYVTALGRRPGRQTDAAGLIAESRAWHRQLAGLHFEDLALPPGHRYHDPDALLPPAPGAPWHAPNLHVRAIRTPRELVTEGCEMHNCVASYLPRLVSGESFIYSVTALGERLTVQVSRTTWGLVIAQVAGIANQRPGNAARAAVDGWLAEVTRPPRSPAAAAL